MAVGQPEAGDESEPQPMAGSAPAARFVAVIEADESIPADARALVRKSWDTCVDCDGGEFLIQGIAVLSERFGAGLDAYDQEEHARCAEIMHGLRADANPFIAVNAAAFEIKSLVAADRLGEAGERLSELHAAWGDGFAAYTYLDGEMAFLKGYCLLADLDYAAAQTALQAFLDGYPGASQRLVLSARQMLAELAQREPGRIGEVADLMNYAGRRLAGNDAGERVQSRQQRIVDLLNRLIEEAEGQEQSSGDDDSGGGGGSGRGTPKSPLDQSRLPSGGPGEGPLRESRRANPGEAWGAMPPAERERVLQALRESFPGRYRRLVEQYYEELAKKR